jgi:hypothetical protein
MIGSEGVIMKAKPVLAEMTAMVWILKEDFAEFAEWIKGKDAPEWVPVNYRVTAVERTHFIPESEPHNIVRVRFQFVGQTKK